ncbi:MAG: hypothetical protein DRQ51_08205 [Gammaproteobacteria bacterium]|nr:MAG: hypothetical protein DRQ51_08205 [Gammaproteobacteria bacterium]
MKYIITLFLLIIAFVIMGVIMKNEPGMVLIYFNDKEFQTSLIVLSLIFVILYTIAHTLLKIIIFVIKLPSFVKKQNQKIAVNRLLKMTENGLIAMAEGNWIESEKLLKKYIKHNSRPLVSLLALAKVSHEQNNHQKRDDYLRQAIIQNPQASLAVGLTQAELQYSHNQTEQAQATLNRLLQENKRHPVVTKRLMQVYNKTHEWQKLFDLLPIIKKNKILSSARYSAIYDKTCIALLQQSNIDYNKFEKIWDNFDKNTKNHAIIFKSYIMRLVSFGQMLQAYQKINKYLQNNNWNEDIITIFGTLKVSNLKEQLHIAESCLTNHKSSPALYLTLARICVKLQLWGQAKSYYSQNIYLNPTAIAYKEQGQLLEKIKDDNFYESYKKGLEKITT